jgi:hypothetical protein
MPLNNSIIISKDIYKLLVSENANLKIKLSLASSRLVKFSKLVDNPDLSSLSTLDALTAIETELLKIQQEIQSS